VIPALKQPKAVAHKNALLSLWEKAACEAGRMRGVAATSASYLNYSTAPSDVAVTPHPVAAATTFSHKGRRGELK
jgi:hypothetical protein